MEQTSYRESAARPARGRVRHEKAALQYGVVCGTKRTADTVVARSGERVNCLRCQKITKRSVAP